MAKSRKPKSRQSLGLKLTLLAIVTVVLGISLLWQNQINYALRLVTLQEGAYEGTNAQVIRSDGGDLVVHFIDVGQGDACVVELPDDRNLIIDAGPGKNKTQLLTYLSENFFFTRFDIAILTHSDEDHAGGFPDVLSRYDIGTFYRPNELCVKAPYVDPDASKIVGSGKKNTAIYRNTIEAAHKASDEVVVTYMPDLDQTGYDLITPDGKQTGDPGYYEIQFFGPYGHSYRNLNDYSPIIILEYEDTRIALSGDAEAKAEAEFIENAEAKPVQKFRRFTDSYSVNVIKLGHHGSKTSSSEAYLSALTTPASTKDVLVILSCGAGNSYGHPHKEVLSRLSDLGFSKDNILRTDQNGTVVLAIRYDDGLNEGAGGYALFYGASAHNVETSAPVSWLHIAIGIWVLVLLLLFAPMFLKPASGSGKRAKRRR